MSDRNIVLANSVAAAISSATPAEIEREVGNQYRRFGFPDGGTATGNGSRRKHLRRLQLMREGRLPEPEAQSFCGVEISIPELDYYVLVKRFPDLRSKDPEIKRRAWLKLANSPAGEKYRVRRKRRPGSVPNVLRPIR